MINELLKQVILPDLTYEFTYPNGRKEILPWCEPEYEGGNPDFSVGYEYENYYSIARLLKPESVLEIGIYKGLSTCSIMAGSPDLKTYVGVDGEKYISNSNKGASRYIEEFINLHSTKFPHLRDINWKLISTDTMKDPLEKEALDQIYAQPYDWVHIDGAHEEGEAYKDVIQFWFLTKKYMTIHDYEEGHPHVKKDLERIFRERALRDVDCCLTISSGKNFALIKRR